MCKVKRPKSTKEPDTTTVDPFDCPEGFIVNAVTFSRPIDPDDVLSIATTAARTYGDNIVAVAQSLNRRTLYFQIATNRPYRILRDNFTKRMFRLGAKECYA